MREKLFKYLKDNKIKKGEFYSQLGLYPSTMYHYLKGHRDMPKYVKLAIAWLTKGKVQL